MIKFKSILLSILILIFYSQASLAEWEHLPCTAKDIAISGDAVWVVGLQPVYGGYSIYHWNHRNWQRFEGGAAEITVERDGTVWLVGLDSGIYRWAGNNWARLEGNANRIAVDGKGRPSIVNQEGGIFKYTNH